MHSDHAHAHAADDPHAEHGVAKYIYVFVALCMLTMMSFLTYSHFWPAALSDPHVKWLFMMAVSCTKAMLVILFFMHLKSEANWKYVLTIPASIMSVFLVLALVPDIGLRRTRYSEARQEHVATQADAKLMEKEVRKAMHESHHE